MKEFLKSTLRGSGQGISSKRVAFFLCLIVFFGEHAAYYFLKMPPNPTLGDQLFTMLLVSMGVVAAEPAVEAVKIKAQQPQPSTP